MFVNITFLWGTLFIAVPVLIHLLLRQKLKKVLFSSIHHIPEGPTLYKSKINFRELLLLLLRCLIILCIVAAFAGLVLINPRDTGKRKLHFIAIDNTVSTSLKTQSSGVMFDKITLNTIDYVNRQNESDLFFVYSFSSGFHPVKLSRQKCVEFIESLEIQAGMKDFSNLTDSVNSIDRSKYHVFLYMASDFSPRVVKNISSLSDKTEVTKVILYRSHLPERVNNTALTKVEINGYDSGRISGRALIQNRGMIAVRKYFTISSLDYILFETSIELLPEEEKSIRFSIDTDNRAIRTSECLPLEFRITPSDMISVDDVYRAGIVIPNDQTANILLIGQTGHDLILLKAALESLSVCPETKTIRYDEMLFSNLNLDNLLNYDSVVFTTPAQQILHYTKELKEYIISGGSLHFFVNKSVKSKVTAELFDSGLISAKIKERFKIKKAAISHSSQEELKHKLGNYNLNLLHFSQMFQVTNTSADSDLLLYDTGDVFVCSKTMGTGKTVFINTSADVSMSSLSSSSVWPLFCRELFSLSYGITDYSSTVGEDIEISLGNSLSNVTVHNTDSTVSEYDIADSRIIITPAKKIGWIYCEQPEIYVGVHAHPDETVLSATGDLQIRQQIAETFRLSSSRQNTIQKAGRDYKLIPLWKYLLAGALILVLFDYFISNILKK